MKPRSGKILFMAILGLAVAAEPVATAYALCHTNQTAEACGCCEEPNSASSCSMDCVDGQQPKKAEPLAVTLPHSEQQAALHTATPAFAAGDATGIEPLRLARILQPSSEALYLIDCALRL